MSLTSVQLAIVQTAQSMGVDPALALAVAKVESNFNQSAIGASGEVGIFQLLPATAASLGVNPYDQTQNIQGGIEYLAQMISSFGDIPDGLAAYNWGPTNVNNAGSDGLGLGDYPASVNAYVNNVLSAASSFSAQLNSAPVVGPTKSPVVIATATLPSNFTLSSILPSSDMGYLAWAGGLLALWMVID